MWRGRWGRTAHWHCQLLSAHIVQIFPDEYWAEKYLMGWQESAFPSYALTALAKNFGRCESCGTATFFNLWLGTSKGMLPIKYLRWCQSDFMEIITLLQSWSKLGHPHHGGINEFKKAVSVAVLTMLLTFLEKQTPRQTDRQTPLFYITKYAQNWWWPDFTSSL